MAWLASVSHKVNAAILRDNFHIKLTKSTLSSNGDKIVFYVALDGNDAWSGTLANPNRMNSDGPFATIQRARDAIREIKYRQNGNLTNEVTVFIREGIYFLTEPWVFTPEDSGTENCPIVYLCYPNENVIISGGRRIVDFRQESVNGRILWVSDISQVREGKWFFRQLWVNGERCIRSRYPKHGYLQVANVPDVTSQTKWHEGQTRFRFHRGDVKAWASISDAEVVIMTRWVESRLPITTVDEEKQLINFSNRSVFQIDRKDPYYIENCLEILENPGEWYLNQKSGKIYYLPRDGENIENAEFIAPLHDFIIKFEGKPDQNKFIEYLTFRQLNFNHAEWYYSDNFQVAPYPRVGPWPHPDVLGSIQSANNVPGALQGEGIRYCNIEECKISHISNYAIELSRGCYSNQVIRCELFDLGAGGVKIGESIAYNTESPDTYDNQVTECHIYDGGKIFHSAVGIWVGQSYRNLIAGNHIYNFYYTGVSVGWNWHYQNTKVRDNIIKKNHIHHIGKLLNGDGPILKDFGAIYVLGVQPGTQIISNLIHDVDGLRNGGFGIHLDQGSSQILIENNLVYRTYAGLNLHYGRENIIRNNIFCLGRVFQLRRLKEENHLSFTFERNIVYWSEGDLFVSPHGNDGFVFDYNLYWNENGIIQPNGMDWNDWQKKGMDNHSLIKDPLFVDIDKDNFTLSLQSPAFKLGFQPI
ncbi:right-handed parallel beta-helix repeat-containing protein [Oxynema sp. CENA135]|uniref:right-handed parallel beta-helix repeat-containing protein n=1 Tax=Oxynema sp. CENA135 TaxID=984206 RepID=UPI00190D2A06|nr:right-handed parallel beta-helix repeat-containing protein [Oxynema sp. CENA135]